jgi:uncharacterized membrane protein YdbT with pleckstrin-like domain
MLFGNMIVRSFVPMDVYYHTTLTIIIIMIIIIITLSFYMFLYNFSDILHMTYFLL